MFNQPNPQTTLPVSPTQPNQQMYIQGLPQQIPFQIPLQLPTAQQQQLLAPVAGLFLAEVQNNADKNGMRTFTFNYLSQGGYQNQEFLEAVKGAVEYADMLIGSKQYDPQQAVSQAATEMASIVSSLYAKKFPELLRYAPQGADRDADRWIGRMSDIRAEIDRWTRAQTQPQQQQWGGQPQQQPWGAQPQGWQQQPQQQPWGGQPQQQPWGQQQPQQPWGAQQSPMGPRGPHQSSFVNRPNPAQMGVSNQTGGMFQTPATPTPQSPIQAGVRGSSLGRRKHQVVAESMDEQGYHDHRNEPVAPQQPAWKPTEPEPEPMFAEDPFEEAQPERSHDRLVKDNMTAMPAHLSGLTATYSIKRPYRMAYDPKTHVKFHVQDHLTGDVKEMVEEATPEMDYLTHETDPKIRHNLPKRDDGKVIAADHLFASSEHVTMPLDIKDVSEDILADIADDKKMMVMPEIYTATSESAAYCLARLDTQAQGLLEQWDRRPVQFSYYQVYPLMNTVVGKEEDADLDLSEVLNVTLKLETVEDYLQQLHRLHKNPLFPKDVLSMLNHHSTIAVNEALQYGLGLDWHLDSFMQNWTGDESEASLYDDFIEEFGEEQGAALYDVMLEKSSKTIIGGGLSVMTGDVLESCYGDRGALVGFKEDRNKLVVLGQFCTRTCVQWESNEVSLVLEDGGAVLLESKLPQLHGAVKAMITQARKSYSGFQRMGLITADAVTVNIHEGLMGKDYFILDTQ